MTASWKISIGSERQMRLLAELVATKVTAGNMIALRGDLGTGKTTFSRYLIRALLHDDTADVPSPTFTLLQTYETDRFEVRHFDLYRVSGSDELSELDFEDEDGSRLTLVEWPERAEDWLAPSRIEITICDETATPDEHPATTDGDARQVTLQATPNLARRLARIETTFDFLRQQFSTDTLARIRLAFLQGDASARGYARLSIDDQPSKLLMDMPPMPDGPVIRDGKTYSEIAHLAEDAGPFVAIAAELREAGLSAPEIHIFDEARGLALIEDFGPLTFAEAITRGIPQETLWHAAVDTLVTLYQVPVPEVSRATDGTTHRMPVYDADVMTSEISLLPDWYWPHTRSASIPPSAHDAFNAAWQPLIRDVAYDATRPETHRWVLRDYHSPNLIWLSDRASSASVGIIDFQDAQIGHAAYDLVSLLQDARLDVPRALHDTLLDHYCAQLATIDAKFDIAKFRRAYAILGAQRNTKILGIFARLANRDNKPGYLRHIPRIKQYLRWCLEHSDLVELKSFYDTELRLND